MAASMGLYSTAKSDHIVINSAHALRLISQIIESISWFPLWSVVTVACHWWCRASGKASVMQLAQHSGFCLSHY